MEKNGHLSFLLAIYEKKKCKYKNVTGKAIKNLPPRGTQINKKCTLTFMNNRRNHVIIPHRETNGMTIYSRF